MKTIKKIIVCLAGAVGALIPLWSFWHTWVWCMGQVPIDYAWAGLARIGITLAMVSIGGYTIIMVSIFSAFCLSSIIAAILD